jgi:hypothetical protein
MDFMRSQMRSSNEKCVGRLPVGMLKEFRDYIDDKDHMETNLEIRKKQMIMEMETKLKDEFGTRMESIEIRHDNLWDRIYDALDLNPNGSYYFNRKTGEIIMRVDDNEDAEYHSRPFNF